jgi:hypothetical protein
MLRRRIQQQFPSKKVMVDETYDGVKMSEVLKAFVAPYRHLVETEEAFQRLLAIAVTAWNIALWPVQEREAHIREILEALPQDTWEDAKEIIDELIERKEEHFSEYRRMIIDYEVTDVGQDYHLTVISTADELKEQ